ncbi:CapA family protein [Leucobacter weissii]|uniref:CapA family protein n=1 Tax=Leucobacter weissii TaxID=1983706 RepID=A0A939MSM9_9MICO|nr:CapA family protein [Leucobacter weissii]MBO1902269.1 CapA family protein [Leucobacter weissii]
MGSSSAPHRRLTLGIAGIALIAALAACAPEPGAESEPVPPTESQPTSEAPPEPEPQPGAGPECPTDHCVSVVMTGDLLFHEGLWTPYAIETDEQGRNFDFVPLLSGQRKYLKRADLAICQMETPLAPSGGPYAGYPAFSTPPELAAAVKETGYDVCTTASNHTVDQGTEGLLRTLDELDAVGIEHTGSYREEGERDEPLIVEANGVKIGIITSTFSLNGLAAEHEWQVDYSGPELGLDPERAIAKAEAAREAGAELVIGVQHAGTEYATSPDIQQISNAEALVDSGEFDFIANHHTHSVQPLELYNDVWIAYGLGNTISESAPPEYRVNNEFLTVRVQFAKQEDGSWETADVSWAAATNMKDGVYRWCSVASDTPQGVCQSEGFDADVRERTRATVNANGADGDGAREWLVTEE